MSFFCAEHISAGYNKTHIVQDVSFTLVKGNIIGILGANGSGKTTLLKAICGSIPHAGSCTLETVALETLSPRQMARLVSYIPQRSGISIDISVLDVVLMGYNAHLGLLEHPTKQMRELAQQALEQVGLSGYAQKNYLHLSEGQKQLCILARTMVAESRLLLLDEPESALDFRYRYRMLDIIRHWVDTTQGGAILTLHDPMLALNYCDQLMLLQNGQVVSIFSPQIETLQSIEQQMSEIYGPVSVQWCKTHSGKHFLTMLKEDIP